MRCDLPTTSTLPTLALMPNPEKPPLILVTGPPASGKSTLAPLLATKLNLCCLQRDPITQRLLDALTEPFSIRTHADTRPVAAASFQVFYYVIDQLIDASVGVVAETNFHSGPSEPFLLPLVARTRMVQVYCEVAKDVSIARFISRARQAPQPLPSSYEERIRRLEAGEESDSWRLAVPVDLDIPLIKVDSTEGYTPSLDELVASCRTLIHQRPNRPPGSVWQ